MSEIIPKLLLISVDEKIISQCKSVFPSIEFDFIQTEDEFGNRFEDFRDGEYLAIVAGAKISVPFLYEVAQITQSQCPKTPSYAVLTDKQDLDLKKLKKNGFKEIFMLPLDALLLKEKLEEAKKLFSGDKVLKKVRSLDLEPDTELPFETFVYLPLNKKYVRFSKSGDRLDSKKRDKLLSHNVGSIYVDQRNMDKFYEYAADNLAKLSSEANPLSSTERQEKINESVRGFLMDIYDDSGVSHIESGKEMISTCQKVISKFITGGESSNWYNNLIRSISGDVGSYSHASEVSTLAALFGLAAGHPKPEDLAMAGFLHDLGMVDVPEDLLNKNSESWSEEEKKKYFNHPERALFYIKKKRMIVPENVEKMIQNHHEMYNGKGFPKGISGDRISEETQILILANQFQYLMEEKEGKKRITPLEALSLIEEGGFVSRNLIKKVKSMMTMESSQQEQIKSA